MAAGVTDITTSESFLETVASSGVVLVYFSYGPRNADFPASLGDEFDPQFQDFGQSDVVPQLCKVTYSDATRGIFSEAGISCEDGGSLVLYREGIELGNISLKSLNDSEELESEVAQWLSGSYPMDAGGAQACPATTGHAMGDAERTPVASPVPGQTPGVMCGAAPKGPPPGPKPPSSQPTSTVTFGAALSGPPPGPTVAASPVPGQTPGVMCGAAPKGPPPGPKPPSNQPTSTVTFGAALSGPPPGPKVAASPVPGQTPGVMCGAAPKGPPPGPKPPSNQPTSTVTFGAALAGPPPGPKAAGSPVPGQTPGPSRCEAKGDEAADLVDDADIRTHAPDCHQVTKLISMHERTGGGVMSREKLKLLLQLLLQKHAGKTRLHTGHLDRVLDAFMEETSENADKVEACHFVEWAWGTYSK